MWQKFGLAIELAKELAFLRKQVNGYFVAHSAENGVLWQVKSSQVGARLGNAFSSYLGTAKPKIFPPAPNIVGPLRDTVSSKLFAESKIRITMAFLKFGSPDYVV